MLAVVLEMINSPLPFFCQVVFVAVLAKFPVKRIVPAPSKVTARVLTPLSMSPNCSVVALSAEIVAFPARLTVPLFVFTPLTFRRAPFPPTPVPVMEIFSAVLILLLKASVPPSLTTVLPLVVPKAELFPARRVDPFRIVVVLV